MDRQFKANFLKGSFFSASGAILSAAFHVLTIVIMARIIPRADFGIYALILASASFLNVIAGMGLDLTLTKYASEDDKSFTGRIILPIAVLRAIALFVVGSVTFIFASSISSIFKVNLSPYVPYVVAICVCGSYRDLLVHLVQGLRLFKQFAALNILTAVSKCFMTLFFLLTSSLSLAIIIKIEIAAILLTLIAACGIIAAARLDLKWDFSYTRMKELLKFAFPLHANAVLTILHTRMGIFMLAALSTPIGVALFDVAGKVPEGFLKLFRSFITVYFPNQSKLFASGKKNEALSLMNKSIGLVSAATLGLVLFSFLFQQEVVISLFSSKYSKAALAFALLMLNFHMRAIVNIMGYSLVSAGISSAPMKVNSIACIVNLGCNLLLIPAYGFMGAVYSLLIMNAISQVLFGYFLARAGLLVNRESLLIPSCLTLAVGASYLPCGTESVIIRIALIGVYIGLSYFFVQDLRRISSMLLSKCLESFSTLYSREAR